MRRRKAETRRNGMQRRTPEKKGEENWDRGDWSRDRRGNWQWSVDFTKVEAADAALQQPAVDLAAIVAAAVKAAVASVQA